MDTSDEEVEIIPPSPTRAEVINAGVSRTTGAVGRPVEDREGIIPNSEAIQIQDDEDEEIVDMLEDESYELSGEDNSDVEIIQVPEEAEVIEIDAMDEVAVFVTTSDAETDGNESVPASRPATPLPDDNPPEDRPLTPAVLENIPLPASPDGAGISPERLLEPEVGENPPPERPVTPAVDLNPQPAVGGATGQDRPLPPVEEENSPPHPLAPTPLSGAVQPPALAASSPTPGRNVRTLTPVRNTPADFRSPKRRKLMSPEQKRCPDEEEDDADSCPICFDPWTNSGSHRLASLRCGHLFGQSCIDKWLRGQGGKCPHCNAKAKRLDIRVIYAKSLKALDTTERDHALAEVEREKELRKKAELGTAQARLQYQLAVDECNRMRFDLNRCRQQLNELRSNPGLVASTSSQSSQSSQARGQYVTDKTIKIFDAGGCRVLTYSPFLAALVISQPSSSQLFPGFGVKKLNAVDFKTNQYVTVHSKPIRDLSFHPDAGDGFMLSCSIDKSVKLTNLVSNTVMQSYDTAMPVWSCSWNAEDRNYFYVGQQNGTVLEFDIRNTESFVQELNTEGSRAPIVSLQYVPSDQQAAFRPGGLLVGQLDKITFYERKAGDYKLHLLPTDNNLTSLHFEPKTRHILSSFRPTAKHPTVRHLMSELTCTNISTDPTEIESLCSSNMVQTFHGGKSQKILAKTILTTCPSDQSKVLACAGDEGSQTVQVWDTSSGQQIQKLTAGGTVVDMCSLQVNNQHYLATLTDKLLKVHKWS